MAVISSSKNLLIAITGPTASGKTDTALKLAKKLPLELISCDSMQVYRGMPVLTQASPRSGDRHLRCQSPSVHLSQFLSPSEEYNAALFRKDALSLIEKILKKKKIPCFVGGTGLYLRALLDGLFDADETQAQDLIFRKKMLKLHEKHGAPFLHEKLKKIDEASALKIHPNDARRLVRALEVHHLTGKSMSEQKPKRQGVRDDFDCRIFFLDCDRAALYERIHRRVDKMWKSGLLNEVKKIRKKKLSKTAGVALGVREIGAFIEEKTSKEEALELLKKNTRHYAKRQISWFRHEKGVTFVPVSAQESSKDIAAKIASLLTGPGPNKEKLLRPDPVCL